MTRPFDGLTWLGRIVAVAAVLVLGYVVVYRLLFQGQDLARERGGRTVAEGQRDAAEKTAGTTLDTIREREVYRETVRDIVTKSEEDVNAAWQGESVGKGVDRAGADALCRLHRDLCRDPAAPVQPVR